MLTKICAKYGEGTHEEILKVQIRGYKDDEGGSKQRKMHQQRKRTVKEDDIIASH